MTNGEMLGEMLRKTFPRTIFSRGKNQLRGTQSIVFSDEWLKMPYVQPEPKTGYISIADVMSVFDDFMRGEVDEDGNETFLEMLKDKAESEGKDGD